MRKISIILLFASSLLVFSLSSCYNESEEELYPGCDTSNVTYRSSIANVFAANCNSCHSGENPSAGIVTANYDDVVNNISRIMGSISHQAGYKPMPKDGNMLTNCEIMRIDIWVTKGMSNN